MPIRAFRTDQPKSKGSGAYSRWIRVCLLLTLIPSGIIMAQYVVHVGYVLLQSLDETLTFPFDEPSWHEPLDSWNE